MRGRLDEVPPTPARIALQVLRLGAVLVLVFVVARAAYFPVWAAGANNDQLARSWGGPNPLLATLAHWLVAGVVGAICVGLVVLSGQILRRR